MNVNWTDIGFFLIPAFYLLTAALSVVLRAATGWRLLQGGNLAVLVLVALVAAAPAPLSGWFLHTPANLLVLALVAFVGLVVARFATQYLNGDAGQPRFQRWLQVTLACVAVVIISNHLLLLLVAWTGISLSLHQLLMFYPERKRAALAAHKKFLFARLAELCLGSAALLLYFEHGSFFITDILSAYAGDAPVLGIRAQLAAVLLASAAMVKCAQFPMHGWLIQVVEAPTPVSALLHAGIINLGGYLLVTMAPLMIHAAAANALLLVVAGLTCVVAALVTMTRVSIKVMLAWSTVAQMGLMLVECALGQYGLALLHLVAHSCYKAYSFLNSGSQVEVFLRQQLARPAKSGGLAAPVFLVLTTAAFVSLWFTDQLPAGLSLWLLFAMMLLVMFSERGSTLVSGSGLRAAAVGSLLLLSYTAQKLVFEFLSPVPSQGPGLVATLWCYALFSGLLFAYWLLNSNSETRLARSIYRNLYAGLYLDEWATRATLLLWPVRFPEGTKRKQVHTEINTETSA